MMLNVSIAHTLTLQDREVGNARANGANIYDSVRKVMRARCLIEWHRQTLSAWSLYEKMRLCMETRQLIECSMF